MSTIDKSPKQFFGIEAHSQDTINHIASEVSHDFRCAIEEDNIADKIRWNNRCVVGLLIKITEQREEIAALRASDQRADRLEKALGALYSYCSRRSCEETRWEGTMMTMAREALATPSGGEKSGPSDSEMLDWLELQLSSSTFEFAHHPHRSQLSGEDAERFDPKKPFYAGTPWNGHCGSNLRAAITSAMEDRA